MYGAGGSLYSGASQSGQLQQGQGQGQQLQQQQAQTQAQSQQYLDEEKVYALILDLTLPGAREGALLELSKKREAYEGLAPILWHSFGTFVYASLVRRAHRIYLTLSPHRRHDGSPPRDCLGLSLSHTPNTHWPCLESRL